MLTDKYGHMDLKEIILPPGRFRPFPCASERKGWEPVMQETRDTWLSTAEQYKEFSWPALPKDKFLHFARSGDNLSYLLPFFERRSVLGVFVLAECIEGKGRFLEQIVNGIFTICEETAWLTPFDLSKLNEILPSPADRVTDLASSETGALLVWTQYLLKEQLDAISPRICRRIETEVRERVIIPYMEHDDYWWMGFVKVSRVNNWNPWCNRNVLMYFLLLEKDPEARSAGISKVMRSLDAYLGLYPPDGCCDEGPMYWGAAGGGLHTCLSLLCQASSGRIDVFDERIVQDIGKYIYKVHIHDDCFVNFADGDAHVKIGAGVYNYGSDIQDRHLMALGACAPSHKPDIFIWFGMYEYLLDIFSERTRQKEAFKPPYIRDAWMGHTQVMTAREYEGSEKGYFLAVKGGHNAEAHNHNDVGNFIVYIDGKPLIIDLGTEEYSAKTFSKQRFELWYLQSQYHNCPTIRGELQKDGKDYRASETTYCCMDSISELKTDIAGAYPGEAGICAWNRTCRLNRGTGASVEVTDEFVLTKPAADIEYNLITPCEPSITANGRIELQYAAGKKATLSYDCEHLDAYCENIDMMGSRLRRNWGERMYRLRLVEKTPVSNGIRRVKIERTDI